jgi:DNA polymerase III sliding clamp (beta) subunit (PCNA family)
MKTNRKDLLNALKNLLPAIDIKGAHELYPSFIFSENKIMAYNNEILISCEFQHEISGSVKSKKLYELISKLKEDEIDILVDETELRINSKKIKVGLQFTSEISIPKIQIDNSLFTPLPDNFNKGLDFCLFSASTDQAKFPFTTLLVKEGQIISCDNHRGTRYNLNSKIENEFIIDAKIIKNFTEYKSNSYYITDEWLPFKNEENIIFSCHRLQGKYPDTTSVFSVEGDTIIFPESLQEALSHTKIINDEMVSFHVIGNKIIIRGFASEGWIEEEIEMEGEFKEVFFKINPKFFQEILLKAKDSTIVSESKMLFNGEDFVHTIALVSKE